MGSQKWSDHRFGERVKIARNDRGWSQVEMAKLLANSGVQPMHSTTVAKIEAGDRSVRINEAVGIAELFGVSLDALMGRSSGPFDQDLAFALRVLRDSARQSSEQALAFASDLQDQARHVIDTFEFDGVEEMRDLADTAHRRLDDAYLAVEELALLTEDVLRTNTTAARKPRRLAKAVRDE